MALKPEKLLTDNFFQQNIQVSFVNEAGIRIEYKSLSWNYVPECISHSFSPQGYQEGYQTRKTIHE